MSFLGMLIHPFFSQALVLRAVTQLGSTRKWHVEPQSNIEVAYLCSNTPSIVRLRGLNGGYSV
jgi:hypothetical protein